jgi:(p)ppGpp synthase/HD superfamily hydrolase
MVHEVEITDRLLRRAKRFATDAHVDARYGDHPYTVHLQDVESVLIRFGHTDELLLAAAWLHDVWEDCLPVFKYRLHIQFPATLVALVMAVSNEPGANRKERAILTYPKILAGGSKAIILKLADRIANAEFSMKENSRFLEMYREEYPEFRAALYRTERPEDEDAMWDHLDGLMMFGRVVGTR